MNWGLWFRGRLRFQGVSCIGFSKGLLTVGVGLQGLSEGCAIPWSRLVSKKCVGFRDFRALGCSLMISSNVGAVDVLPGKHTEDQLSRFRNSAAIGRIGSRCLGPYRTPQSHEKLDTLDRRRSTPPPPKNLPVRSISCYGFRVYILQNVGYLAFGYTLNPATLNPKLSRRPKVWGNQG